MSTFKPPDIAKLTKQFIRLNLAKMHFLQAKALATKLIEQPIDPLDYTFSPLIAGIVVTYAKSFVENSGIGQLDKAFSNFTDAEMKDTHDKLLKFRHTL